MINQKGLHATVIFVLEGKGVNVITGTFNPPELCCGEYCTSYCGNPYSQKGTRVFGAWETAVFESALVADYFLEFCITRDIPIIFNVPNTPFNNPDVIISLK